MRGTKTGISAAFTLLAATSALLTGPSAMAAPSHIQVGTGVLDATAYTCEGSGTAVRTLEPTPVHTGPYGSATVWDTLPANSLVHTYWRCINKYNNIWYAITDNLDTGGSHRAGFIYSGYVKS
ncbi:hypothetical protein [Streptomyces halstedii]|uniref:hypothetical protein n=1 Tax=Streptomyces halstedii TaxID=1944 RepID=UPI0038239A53